MVDQLVSGRLDYVHKPSGRLRGHEYFMIGAASGKNVQTSVVNIYDSAVRRLIFMEFDQDWRPVHATCSVTAGAADFGNTFFSFGRHEVEAFHRSQTYGSLRQTMPLANPVQAFGTHSVMGDGLQILGIEPIEVGGRFRLTGRLSSSEVSNGATLQMITPGYSGSDEPAALTLVRHDDTTLGLSGAHYVVERYSIERRDRAPLDVWLSRELQIPLKLSWAVYETDYVVNHLTVLPQPDAPQPSDMVGSGR